MMTWPSLAVTLEPSPRGSPWRWPLEAPDPGGQQLTTWVGRSVQPWPLPGTSFRVLDSPGVSSFHLLSTSTTNASRALLHGGANRCVEHPSKGSPLL